MCVGLRSLIAWVTIGIVANHCGGIPIPDDSTNQYSFYYKVYDLESNNYQGHVERTVNGVTIGTYYHLGPDGKWYETTYSNDGTGLKSEANTYDSADQLSVNAFGPESERRSDEGEIVIANGAGVIGGTMFDTAPDDIPVIQTRRGGGVSDDEIRDTILGHRPIVFGSQPIDNREFSSRGPPSPVQPPNRNPGREIVFGLTPNVSPDQDIGSVAGRPSAPDTSLTAGGGDFASSFDSFDPLFQTNIGSETLDGNLIPENQPETIPDNISDFDAQFDTLG